MNGNAEAAEGWLRKAESDLEVAEVCIESAKGLDAACFHCQQAAEKSLKAWLVKHDEPFPFIHDLAELIALCQRQRPVFTQLLLEAKALSPFAVAPRYEADFWPTSDVVRRPWSKPAASTDLCASIGANACIVAE